MTLKPVNVLYFSSFGDDMRGGQQSLFNLVSNINREVFGVYVIVPSENGGLAEKLRIIGIDVLVVELPKILDYHLILKVKALSKLLRIINKHKIEIIHTDGPRNTLYAGVIAKIKNIPLIWHVRAFSQDRYDWILQKLSSKTILVADALQSRFRIKDNDQNFVTIHNGVDLSIFEPQMHDQFVRLKYNIDHNELIISVTARIERLKGQKYLIEACGKIKSRIRDFHILLAGQIVDSSYLKECQDKAEEYGIKDRVIFAGKIENVSQVLNETDIFVLPSLLEAFPRSVIEAMSTGKPVIVTNVGGCSEAFEDGISGFLVPAKNSGAMADKILLLAKSRNLREKIGREARCRVEKKFEIRDTVKQIENLYYEVL
jgi:glycosyltransferase involved in cell wall biosynthesis